MSKFAYPEWRLPPTYYDPTPPLDPKTQDDLDSQVEDALNGFIEGRLKVLHTDLDAHFRGREAVEGVDGVDDIVDRLNGVKAEPLAGAGTEYERSITPARNTVAAWYSAAPRLIYD